MRDMHDSWLFSHAATGQELLVLVCVAQITHHDFRQASTSFHSQCLCCEHDEELLGVQETRLHARLAGTSCFFELSAGHKLRVILRSSFREPDSCLARLLMNIY